MLTKANVSPHRGSCRVQSEVHLHGMACGMLLDRLPTASTDLTLLCSATNCPRFFFFSVPSSLCLPSGCSHSSSYPGTPVHLAKLRTSFRASCYRFFLFQTSESAGLATVDSLHSPLFITVHRL